MNGFTGSLEDKTFAALLPIQLFFAPYFIILEHADQKKMHAVLAEYLKDSKTSLHLCNSLLVDDYIQPGILNI